MNIAKWILGILLIVVGLIVCAITVLGGMMSDTPVTLGDNIGPLGIGGALVAAGVAVLVWL